MQQFPGVFIPTQPVVPTVAPQQGRSGTVAALAQGGVPLAGTVITQAIQQPTQAIETTFSLLSRMLPILNAQQIQTLVGLTYRGTSQPIINLADPGLINEIVGMIYIHGFEPIWAHLNTVTNRTDVIWNGPGMNPAKEKLVRQMTILRGEKLGVVGVDKCVQCGSDEVIMVGQQMTSGDEATTVFVACVRCPNKWTRR
jgi:hypothetical protein